MKRQRLAGGPLRSGGYDSRQQLLELEFVDGRIRQFRHVPEEVWRRLVASPNPGSFYEDRIAEEYPQADAGRAVDTGEARAKLDDLFGPPPSGRD
jgi:hypothetical protein